MRAHVVYAHPRAGSFTHAVLDAFTAGLRDAGRTVTVSDLYAKGFQPLLAGEEYRREATAATGRPVAPDVAAEQAALEAADLWAFVYPVWWTDCPAILKGWFDRVWSVGWAYGDGYEPRRARKALVLCTAGNTRQTLLDDGRYRAMETVMLADRIADRAREAEFHLFGGSDTLPPDEWPRTCEAHLAAAHELGRRG